MNPTLPLTQRTQLDLSLSLKRGVCYASRLLRSLVGFACDSNQCAPITQSILSRTVDRALSYMPHPHQKIHFGHHWIRQVCKDPMDSELQEEAVRSGLADVEQVS